MPTVTDPIAAKLSLEQLVTLLATYQVQPVGLTTDTRQVLRGGHPFEGKVIRCISRRSGMIGADYQNAVNNQRAREGQPITNNDAIAYFRSGKLWNGAGEHVAGNRHLVRHKKTGKLFLIFFPRLDRQHQPIERRSYYDEITGAKVCAATVDNWRRATGGTRKQATDKPILWRLIGLESLVEITLDKFRYQLREPHGPVPEP